jgi:hypothetical protein
MRLRNVDIIVPDREVLHFRKLNLDIKILFQHLTAQHIGALL